MLPWQRQKDYSVFSDELNRWGVKTTPKLGTIALCESDSGLGMASFYLENYILYK